MSTEDVKSIISDYLAKLGGTDVMFEEVDNNILRALFDATELTSFKDEVLGWTTSGVQLDDSKKRKYKIEFKKN